MLIKCEIYNWKKNQRAGANYAVLQESHYGLIAFKQEVYLGKRLEVESKIIMV